MQVGTPKIDTDISVSHTTLLVKPRNAFGNACFQGPYSLCITPGMSPRPNAWDSQVFMTFKTLVITTT